MLFLGMAVLVAGCDKPKNVEDIKVVRTVAVEKTLHDARIPMTGQIEAHTYINAAFQISGKIVERLVSVGDAVKAGQPLARLDSQIEKDSLTAAQAEWAAAKAVHEQAALVEKRAAFLVQSKAVSQNDYDDALRQLKSALAQVQGAEAKVRIANQQLNYTVLKADAGGLITEKNAEVGEVVSPGQSIVRIAATKSTDAVFDMPEDVMRRGLGVGQKMRICLDSDHSICADGAIYEAAPHADQITRTYLVKVMLKDVPSQMLLGATAIGILQVPEDPSIQIPSSALTTANDQSAVWLVDTSTNTVRSKAVKVERYTADAVVIADGLQPGDIVVTAGVQSLHQDQKVKWQDENHVQN